MPPHYKFVEVSPVTDEALETCVNDWVGQGWQLEGIRFVVTEHSKRPAMAFVSFIRDTGSPRPPVAAGQPRVIVAPPGDDAD